MITTLNGNFELDGMDNCQSVELLYNRVWESHLLDVINKYVIPGSAAVDAGCNFGTMSIPIARKLGPLGQLYSFDISLYMIRKFLNNIELNNNLAAIHIVNMALSDKCDEYVYFNDIEFENNLQVNYGDIRIHASKDNHFGQMIKTTTIDTYNLDNVSFIKVDCQGYDLKVLRGGVNTITKCRPVVVFEWEEHMAQPHGDTFQDTIDFFSSINYGVEKIAKDDWIAKYNG
jgi:FkbM family methyltransferase